MYVSPIQRTTILLQEFSIPLIGGVIVALFVVPVVNLFAPIIGAAMMVHVFHQNLAEELAV